MPTKKKRINKPKVKSKLKTKSKAKSSTQKKQKTSPTLKKTVKKKSLALKKASKKKIKLSVCQKCKKRISKTAAFCSNCGYNFSKDNSAKLFLPLNLGFIKSLKFSTLKNLVFSHRKLLSFLLLSLVIIVALSLRNEVFSAQLSKMTDFNIICSDIKATSKASNATALIKSDIGYGSGFFIDETHLVTNNHVVETSEKVKVIGKDKVEMSGKIVGWDNKADIAIIQIETPHKDVLKWRSKKLPPGSNVIAIGYPLSNYDPLKGDASVTKGVVSAYRQGTEGIEYLQTDTSINPGNSGGPLVDNCGRVVGINVLYFKLADTQPTFYAISAESAQRVITKLLNNSTTSVPEGTYPAFDLGQDPKEVLALYYDLLNKDQLLDAYQLFTNSRRKRVNPEDWQKLYSDVNFIEVKNMTILSENPHKVKVDLIIYTSDEINDLKQDTVATWTLGYSAGNLLLDDVEVRNETKKAIYDKNSVTQFKEVIAQASIFYSSILKKDLSTYPQSRVTRIKALIELNKKDSETIIKKLTTETPLTSGDLDMMNDIAKRTEEIRSINQEFELEDLKRYYEQFNTQ